MQDSFCPGRVVVSRRGRDAGQYLLVLYTEGDFAFVADGRIRRLEKPKKKRKKHLAPTGSVCEEIASKLAGKTLLDAHLRRALEQERNV